jgi:hypothetical protein
MNALPFRFATVCYVLISVVVGQDVPTTELFNDDRSNTMGLAVKIIGHALSAFDTIVMEDIDTFEVPSDQFYVLASSLSVACPRNIYSSQAARLKPLVKLGGCLRARFHPGAEALQKIIGEDFIQIVFLENTSVDEGKTKNILDAAQNIFVVGDVRFPERMFWSVRERYVFPSLFHVQVLEKMTSVTTTISLPYSKLANPAEALSFNATITPGSEESYKHVVREFCLACDLGTLEECTVFPPVEMPDVFWTLINNHFSSGQYYRAAELTTRESCRNKIAKRYESVRAARGDVQNHLGLMQALAGSVDHVTEFGVRSGVSTLAWLMGGAKTVVGYDLNVAGLDELQEVCNGCGDSCSVRFVEGDTSKVKIDATDLLFIDSLHTGEHLRKELSLHHPKVSKYIVLHDTTACWDGLKQMGAWHYDHLCRKNFNDVHQEGLGAAIDEFMERNGGTWKLFGKKTNNNGLIVLERRP